MNGPNTEEQANSDFELDDWEIWFTYSSYFDRPLPSLETVAHNLVAFGVSEMAITSDGLAWWSTDDTVSRPEVPGQRVNCLGKGQLIIEVSPPGKKGTVRLETDSTLPVYCEKLLATIAALRHGELRLFHEHTSPRYVRAFLGECGFVGDDAVSVVYPHITIFDTGGILVTLRVFGPPTKCSIQRFVEHHVNAPQRHFHRVVVPPGVAVWAPLATASPEDLRWWKRILTAWWQYGHRGVVRENVFLSESNEFAQVSLNVATEQAIALAVQHAFEQATPDIIRKAEEEAGLDKLSTQNGIAEALQRDPDLVQALNNDPAASERVIRRLIRATKKHANRLSNILVASARDQLDSQREYFAGFALTLMEIVGYVAGSRVTGPRDLFTLALLGPGNVTHVGNHWAGRHHIHLVKFSGQTVSARDNEELFGGEFGAIIARGFTSNQETARRHLPPNQRLADDFGAYVAINGSLWVHTSDMSQNEFETEQRICEHQAKVEVLDYAYALHRRIAERATDESVSFSDLAKAEADLAMFEWNLQDVSGYGEIRDFIRQGLEAYEIFNIRKRVMDVIRIRESELARIYQERTNQWTSFLTLILGFLAIPAIIDPVIKPSWILIDLPICRDKDIQQLLYVAASALIVTFLLGIGWVVFLPFRRKRKTL